MALLDIECVSKNFGGLAALSEVSLSVEEGSTTSLIGPNGAGKTTLFNIVTNLIPLDSGKVLFQEERIDHLPPHVIPSKGIARTFQLLGMFKELTVLENVALGGQSQTKAGMFPTIFQFPRSRLEETQIMERAKNTIRLLGLEEQANAKAGYLPYGLQKMVELGRAVCFQPKLVLLDEPTIGLSPHETQRLISVIRKIAEQGTTVFLVAHDMRTVMDISEKIYVLDFGKKIAEGTPKEVTGNEEVIKIYLGREESSA